MQKAFLVLEQGLSKLSLVLGCITCILMLFIIFVEVIARYAFNYSFGVSDEFSGYLLVGMIFLGMAYVASRDAHIKVEVVTSRLPPRTKAWVRVVSVLFFLAFAGILTKLGCDFVFINYIRGVKSNYIRRTPLWIPMSSIAVGFTLLSLSLMLCLVRAIEKLRAGDQ